MKEENPTFYDETQRRILQEYIFNLEDMREKAEELTIANEMLRQSEDFLMAIVASTPHGISLVRNQEFAWCNGAFSRMFGWQQKQLIGCSPRVICLNDEEYESMTDLMEDDSGPKEYDFLHKNGHAIPCMAMSRLLDKSCPAKGIVVSFTDLTELNRTRDQLKEAYRKLEVQTTEVIRSNKQLRAEIEERIEVQQKLDEYRNRLEELVKERTEELRKSNRQLRQEIRERKEKEEKLKFTQFAVDHTLDSVFWLGKDGKFIYANNAACTLLGYETEQLFSLEITDTSEHLAQKISDRHAKKRNGAPGTSFETEIRRRDGRIMPVEASFNYLRYKDRECFYVAMRDITDRKQDEEALRWKTAFLEAQLNSTLDGVLVLDVNHQKVFQNNRNIDLWKMPKETAEGEDEVEQVLYLIRSLKSREQLYKMIKQVRKREDTTTRGELELKDGTILDAYSSPIVDNEDRYYGRIWTFRDITELKRYSTMLENISSTDALTGLPNRRRFDEVLEREWRRSSRENTYLSLVLMDVDFFKEFNDHYGHIAGDECLKSIAGCLSAVVRRGGDLVARYGGEEFACILSNTDQRQAVSVAERIRNEINFLSIQHDYSSVASHITLSFGVATILPDSSLRPSALIMQADELLYSAKNGGRNRIAYPSIEPHSAGTP